MSGSYVYDELCSLTVTDVAGVPPDGLGLALGMENAGRFG